MMKNIFNKLSAFGCYAIFILLYLVICDSASAQIAINEISSSNSDFLIDEDGDDPDWIELKNVGKSSVDLWTYSISDRNDTSRAWNFPSYSLNADELLVIFASGKNRDRLLHWETVIDLGDVWKYLLPKSEPASAWRNTGFNEAGWSSGKTGIGYSDDDDATNISKTVSLFARKTFTVDDTAQIKRIVFNIDFDDAFVAYLNGQEIARDNIGTPGVVVPYNQTAIIPREARMKIGGEPLEFEVPRSLLTEGENVLAVQVHNYSINSSDLSFLPFLTFAMSAAPINSRGVSSHLNFPGTSLHTDFKLNADGESLYLYDSGVLTDSVRIPPLSANLSYGRNLSGVWNFFPTPTPGDENSTSGYFKISSPPKFNYPAGFYPSNIVLVIMKSDPSSIVRYTSDGSLPDKNSKQYTTPINLTKTSVIKARTFSSDAYPSSVKSASYFIHASHNLPTFFISTDPNNLWDPDSGIYVLGRNAESAYPFFGANFWQDWEKPAHIDFFDEVDYLAFGVDCGIKIFGSWSRGADQKSLAIFFRGKYGQRSLDYKLFPQLPYTKYYSFILRNSGNDWSSTMMRDGLFVNLASGMNITSMAFRPAVLYLNGEYWGIHNLREKINEDFLLTHYGVERENLDLLELDGDILTGENEGYNQLKDFVSTHSLASGANYQIVRQQIDIEQFIDYQILNIFIDNTDWPGNNMKFWRDRAGDKKWRWITYDLDFGFGLFDGNAKRHNTLEFATEENGPGWPNPPWGTLMLRKLLENGTFKSKFITRFADLLNTNFRPERVTALIDSLSGIISPEIDSHINRWNTFSRSQWNANLYFLKDFGKERPLYMRAFLTSFFNLNGSVNMKFDIEPQSSGTMRINTIAPIDYPWSGFYFYENNVQVEAVPAPGYEFKEWQGDAQSDERKISANPRNVQKLTAVFVKAAALTGIVINEINYNSKPTADSGDWIELLNNSDTEIDLSGWAFSDEDTSHSFILPDGLKLQSGQYLVLVQDSAKFRAVHPTCGNYLGQFDFGLSNSGETIYIYDSSGMLKDSVSYSDKAPWAVEADGGGSTLELIVPTSDNSVASNWGASSGNGTPGKQNGLYTDADDDSQVVPSEFKLEQNFPNPFNPTTTIKFKIPAFDKYGSEARVSLKVFNTLGAEVATLLNEPKQPGEYEVRFNAAGLPSGIYLCRLQNGNFSQVKKMILLK